MLQILEEIACISWIFYKDCVDLISEILDLHIESMICFCEEIDYLDGYLGEAPQKQIGLDHCLSRAQNYSSKSCVGIFNVGLESHAFSDLM